jgi:hypothetical protein
MPSMSQAGIRLGGTLNPYLQRRHTFSCCRRDFNGPVATKKHVRQSGRSFNAAFKLGHANLRCLVIVAQTCANTEAHLAHNSFEGNGARISLKGRHDALHEHVAFVLGVVESGRNEESNHALLLVHIQPLRFSLERADIATQAAAHNVGGPACCIIRVMEDLR